VDGELFGAGHRRPRQHLRNLVVKLIWLLSRVDPGAMEAPVVVVAEGCNIDLWSRSLLVLFGSFLLPTIILFTWCLFQRLSRSSWILRWRSPA
jgi:hypothetical protein